MILLGRIAPPLIKWTQLYHRTARLLETTCVVQGQDFHCRWYANNLSIETRREGLSIVTAAYHPAGTAANVILGKVAAATAPSRAVWVWDGFSALGGLVYGGVGRVDS